MNYFTEINAARDAHEETMAHLLIIDLPGGNDTDIIDAACDMGHRFSFLSSDLGLYRKDPVLAAALAKAVECLEVPGFAYEEMEAAVLALHGRLPIDAVLCLLDIRLIDAARLAERLRLPHISADKARLLRDKFSVRERLQACGIAQPDFALATSNEELKQAVARLGLPVLIKPADGYGSQNIVVLREPADLHPLMSPLENMLPSRADYGLGVMANDRILVENYMSGVLVGCDTLSVNGRHRMLGVNEKIMFAPPSFAIRGGCFMPNSAQFAALEAYVCKVLDAVGFDWGATHMELMLTAQGPRVIEINPRLVGAKIGRLINLALGRSVHQDLIQVHLGHQPITSPAPLPGQYAATRWITATDFGVLRSLALPASADPLICKIEILRQAGEAVRPPFENADRIACVMACGPDKAAVEAALDSYLASTRLSIAPSHAR